jgi:hypothetical protein
MLLLTKIVPSKGIKLVSSFTHANSKIINVKKIFFILKLYLLSQKFILIQMKIYKKHEESPCISICILKDDGVCIGCGRTDTEVEQWPNYTNAEKKVVKTNAIRRLK